MPTETVTSQSVVTNKPKKREKVFVKTIKQVLKNRLALFGLLIILLQIIVAVFANWFTAYDPVKQNLAQTELLPGADGHWLGTDNYGRDMWSRLIYGARISLLVSISAVALSVSVGVVLGLIAGYYRKLDGIIMRICDLLFAIPGILLAMLIIAILGANLVNVVIAISIWTIPSCARQIRGSVLSVKKQEYITAMKSLGANDVRIIAKHILPNCLAPMIVFATMRMASTIISTAALSYLGLGAQPPSPEWGALISDGQQYMFSSPHMVIIPGIAIMLIVFAFNVVGDAMRDALDPNMNV